MRCLLSSVGLLIYSILLVGPTCAVCAEDATIEIQPGSGPAGTLVQAPVSKGKIKEIAVCLEGQPCAPNVSQMRGTSPVAFAIPLGLKPGLRYAIRIHYENDEFTGRQYEDDTAIFLVEDGARVAHIDRVEVGVNRLRSGAVQGTQLVLYGSGFDLETFLLIDGKRYGTYVPGIDQLVDTTPLLRSFPVICPLEERKICAGFIERVRVAFIEDAASDRGSIKKIQMISRSGAGRESQIASFEDVRLPRQNLLIKLDRIDPSYSDAGVSPEWPPIVVSRHNDPVSLGQVFSSLGYRIDLWEDNKAKDFNRARMSAADCILGAAPGERAQSPGLLLSDVVDFVSFYGTRPDAAFAPLSEGYLHASVLTHLVPDYGFTVLGVYLNGLKGTKIDHRELAVFARTVCGEYSLRTLMHEIGHGLNLTHCDGDPCGITLMNQTQCMNSKDWNFAFSPGASATLISSLAEPDLGLGLETRAGINSDLSSSGTEGSGVENCCLYLQGGDNNSYKYNEGQLVFALDAPKEITVGESLKVTATLSNKGNSISVYPIFEPQYGFSQFRITRTDGKGAGQWFEPALRYDGFAESKLLKRGDQVKNDALVSFGAGGYVFSPGTYDIQAVFRGIVSSNEEPPATISSNHILVKVKDPTSEADRELSMLQLKPETGLFLLVGGGESFGELKAQLEEVVAKAGKGPVVSRMVQETAIALGEYFNKSDISLDGAIRAADYSTALNYLAIAARGPKMSESSSIRFYAERALARGALGDPRSKDDLKRLEGYALDERAIRSLDRVNRLLNDTSELKFDVDLNLLRSEVVRACGDDKGGIEGLVGKHKVIVKGSLARLAAISQVSAGGIKDLGIVNSSAGRAIFNVGLALPVGLEAKQPALQLKADLEAANLPLSPEKLGLPVSYAGIKVSLPARLPCFLKLTSLPVDLDVKALSTIMSWDRKTPLSIKLTPIFPGELERYGGKITGPATLTPP